jgi:hypothetical protein
VFVGDKPSTRCGDVGTRIMRWSCALCGGQAMPRWCHVWACIVAVLMLAAGPHSFILILSSWPSLAAVPMALSVSFVNSMPLCGAKTGE